MVKNTLPLFKAKLFCLIAIVAMLQSCVKDFKNSTSWKPAMALPVLDGSLSFEDIISSADTTYLKSNPDKSLYLIYRSALPSKTAESVVSVPAQSLSNSYGLSAADTVVLKTVGSFAPSAISDTINFNFSNGEEIDHIELKGGILGFDISSTFKDSVLIIINLPSLTKGGVALSDTFDLSYAGGSGPVRKTLNTNLNGYVIDLTNGGTTTNKLAASIKFSFKYLGNPSNTADSINYSVNFSGIKYSYIDGYLGTIPMTLPTDSINMNFFNNAYAGSVDLTDPQVKIEIVNSFGIPIQIDFNKFEAEFADKNRLPIPKNPTSKILQYPATRNDAPKVDTSLSFNRSNSNIASVLSGKPHKLIYGVSATANPSGKSFNFVKDTSAFKIALETKLPLELTINGLAIQDTFPGFDPPSADRLEKIDFKVVTINEFPIDMSLQIYFTDDSYNKIDSLITGSPEIIGSSIIPAGGGRATAGPPKISNFSMDKDRVKKLTNIKHILVKGIMKTYNNGQTPAKFYSDYKLRIKMGMVVKADLLNNQ